MHRYAYDASSYLPGNRVTILRDGAETFPAMLEAIRSARRFVHLEVYIFRDDPIGLTFCEALAERARAGVEVKVLFDSAGCLTTPDACFRKIREADGKVLASHPIAPWRRGWSLRRRDHRKILVVDGRVGFAGGLNLDVCHSSPQQGGAGWRDTHARVEGPVVAELDRHFWDSWFWQAPEEDRPASIEPYLTPAPEAGPHAVEVLANPLRPGRSPIRRSYIAALQRARHRVWITNPYFLPDARITHALGEAAERGVDVRVLVPERSDVRLVDIAARPIFRHLVHKGVRVFLYGRSILHAKTAVVDADWATVGSFNLDPMSFQNLELNLNVRDHGFASQVAEMFLADVAHARELVRVARDRSPAHLRLAEWTLHGLRHWL